MTTNWWGSYYDPSLPIWVDLEDIWLENNKSDYCRQCGRDFKDKVWTWICDECKERNIYEFEIKYSKID